MLTTKTHTPTEGFDEHKAAAFDRGLRDYQRDLHDRFFASPHRRSLLVLPTGAGKTVVAVAIARHFNRVLYFSHRREHVQQTYNKLVDAGASVGDIGFVIPGEPRNEGARIQLGSIQSLAHAGPISAFDLVVVDEAHHVQARSYSELLARVGGARVLGLTATPIRLDGQGFADAFDEILEGPPPVVLIDGQYLARARIFTKPEDALPKVDGVHRSRGDYNRTQLAGRVNRRELTGDIVRDWIARAERRPTLVFAVNRKHSQAIRDRFVAAGVRAAHIDGAMSITSRARTLTDFAAGRVEVICNCDVFGEGFDAPWTRCAVLARPTLSPTLYLQQAGRALRPGETSALILDHAGNARLHGPPESYFDWSLDQNEAVVTRSRAKGKACPECEAVFAWSQPSCGECGYVWPESEREPPVENGDPLVELRAVALSNGIAPTTFKARLALGWSPEVAASKSKQTKGRWPEWRATAKKHGVSQKLFDGRVASGWSEEKAATTRVAGYATSVWRKHGEIVTRGCFEARVAAGWSLDRAASTPSTKDVGLTAYWRKHARNSGVGLGTFRHRVRDGWPMLKAARTPARRAAWHDHAAEAARNGVARGTWEARVLKGWKPNEAASTPPHATRKKPWKYSAIAEKNGVSLGRFNARLRLGWSPKKAASTPLRGKG